MEHESDNYCSQYSYQRINKGTGGLGNKRASGDHPNYCIIEIGQNTEKSPGDLLSLRLQWKTIFHIDVKNSERFWTKIWQPKKHNENAEWINNITRELDGLEEGPEMEIRVDLLKPTLKRISNWKTPGHDGIHGFWFKRFTSFHDRLALEMNRCLQDAQVPEWITKGKTTLIQKDPSKGTAPNNYRPITCLSMMWKILTAQIKEKIYYSPTSRGLFPDE